MQTIEKINLSNLKKCDQRWDKMSPNKDGRICQKCQETIIDFRELSDKEIAEIHTFTEGRVCGLYRQSQLQFVTPKNVNNPNFKAFYLGLIGLLSTTNVDAESQNNAINIVQTPTKNKEQKTTTTTQNTDNQAIKDSVIISGTLKDETGEVLISASVHIKGTKIGVTSDFHGRYYLDITEQVESSKEVVLIFSYIGYQTKEILIDKNITTSAEINVILNENYSDMTEFYVVQPPFHKRIWYRIKGVFKK